MKKNRVIKNGTSIAVKNKEGVIELYPVETVIAVALQHILGIDKTISSIK
ncbi:hypothetical protein [Clostridium drakei]|nr:hypothetical protein [Clostridium drakei]